jgi:serine/threonine protein kinase
MMQTIAGRYQIQRELGQGGMGVVYQARDIRLECIVALKSIAPRLANDDDARRRILREAKIAASLSHPYICRIFDTVDDGTQLFVVMECCEGRTLEGAELSVGDVIRIGSEIAEALEEAHSKGIIHRDLKPSNVMLSRSGHIKIMDFGLAKSLEKPVDAQGQSQSTTSSSLTAKGEILGSTPYMSPEQLRGEAVDARADVFSFGVLLYELLTGHKPFYGASSADTVASILTDRPEPMARYRRGIPEGVEQIVKKMLAKDRNQRYQSAPEVRVALLQAAREKPPPPAFPKLLRSKMLWTALALVIVAAGSMVVYRRVFLTEKSSPAKSETLGNVPAEVDAELFMRASSLSSRFSQSENNAAIAMLDDYLRRHPDVASAHSALALEKLKKFWWYQGGPQLVGEALNHASYARKLDPALIQPQAIAAICKTLHSSDPQGYLELARCLQQEPDQQEALAWLAIFCSKTGNFQLAQRLIDQLKNAHPQSPYIGPLRLFLSNQRQSFAAAKRQIEEVARQFPSWEGIAFAKMQYAIGLSDATLFQQAIDDLRLTNPTKPTIRFWETYLKALKGSAVDPQDLEELRRYIPDDYELAALYAQICARLGNNEEAIKWLRHSVDIGNYDLVQMEHGDFKILQDDPQFAKLKTSLQQKVSRMTEQIQPLVFPKQKTK